MRGWNEYCPIKMNKKIKKVLNLVGAKTNLSKRSESIIYKGINRRSIWLNRVLNIDARVINLPRNV